MNIVFYKTSDVFAAEEKLVAQNIAVEIVPTPVQDKAYCGVCLLINKELIEEVQTLLSGMEYQIVK